MHKILDCLSPGGSSFSGPHPPDSTVRFSEDWKKTQGTIKKTADWTNNPIQKRKHALSSISGLSESTQLNHNAKVSLAFSMRYITGGLIQTGRALFSKTDLVSIFLYWALHSLTPTSKAQKAARSFSLWHDIQSPVIRTALKCIMRSGKREISPCSCGPEEAPRLSHSLHLP